MLSSLPDWILFFAPSKTHLAHAQSKLRRFLKGGPLSQTGRAEAWRQYGRALRHADVEEAARVVANFDSLFQDQVGEPASAVRQSLDRLLRARGCSVLALEAAVTLGRRIADQEAIDTARQNAGLHWARQGEANALLAHLVQRLAEQALGVEQLTEILRAFLGRARFDPHFPWREFFGSLPPDRLPKLHQVQALVGRVAQAAELAEAEGDLRAALPYLAQLEGPAAALHAIELAGKLSDSAAQRAAHLRAGEAFWKEGDAAQALPHFQAAGERARASDCLRRLERFAEAITLRPLLEPEWLRAIGLEAGDRAQAHLSASEFLEAVRLLRGVEKSLREAATGEPTPAERFQGLVTAAVRTVRAALSGEESAAPEGEKAAVCKRWSAVEEAAGNYYEAGLLSQKGGDFYAAARNFEQADHPLEVLHVLGLTEEGPTPQDRARLYEAGGDYFLAALAYLEMGDLEQAIRAFEEIEEFARAAELRLRQIGKKAALEDRKYGELVAKAGRLEDLAQLLWSEADVSEGSSLDKGRLLRRLKELATRHHLPPPWLSRAETGLASLGVVERKRLDEHAARWTAAATTQVLTRYLNVLGIDLGTSNSVVALYDLKSGRPEVVEWRGRPLIPSIFAIDADGREIVGTSEADLMGRPLKALVARAKRAMGTATPFKAGGQLYRAEEISARLLGHFQRAAREALLGKIADAISVLATAELGATPEAEWLREYLEQHPPSIPCEEAVVTVPAYFNEAQKQATHTAAKLAGMTILRLMHEPTAACLAQRGRERRDENVLVVDLGAGTLDLSLIEVSEGVFEVKEIEGDNQLGSSDLDEELYRHFVEVIKAETGHDPAARKRSALRLRQAAEAVKIELSSQAAWSLELPHLCDGQSVRIAMTRAELEARSAPFLERFRTACRKIKQRPARVLLIGGGALMPAIRRAAREVFGMEPTSGLDPLTAVARGAAIQAAILRGAEKETLVLDVTPFSLGIKVLERGQKDECKVKVLLPKHTHIPASKADSFTTTDDKQTQVRVEVYQGESTRPEDNRRIGEFLLDGIVPARAGTPKIEVTFAIDANCLLRVSARDELTGRQREIEIRDVHLLGGADYLAAQRRFAASKEHEERLAALDRIATTLQALQVESEAPELLRLRALCPERLRQFEANRNRYRAGDEENAVLLEIYRDRDELDTRAQLATDKWRAVEQSAAGWLQRRGALDMTAPEAAGTLAELRDSGGSLSARLAAAAHEVAAVVEIYRRWMGVLEGLSIDPEGPAEVLVRHFLRRRRFDEAFTHFQRLPAPLGRSHIQLGLELLERQRRSEEYDCFLAEHRLALELHRPNFEQLKQSMRHYARSVAWIQLNDGALQVRGSGFFLSPLHVATNRHVVAVANGDAIVSPDRITVVTSTGSFPVTAIRVPRGGHDDVAILTLGAEPAEVLPLQLGFSELVALGDRVLAVGFPAPEGEDFVSNLYCNTGLVNRIRSSESCSERVLEVSIPLHGGISGAPLLDEGGQVAGQVTYARFRRRTVDGGHEELEQSFYAIPVEILRRLWAEVQG